MSHCLYRQPTTRIRLQYIPSVLQSVTLDLFHFPQPAQRLATINNDTQSARVASEPPRLYTRNHRQFRVFPGTVQYIMASVCVPHRRPFAFQFGGGRGFYSLSSPSLLPISLVPTKLFLLFVSFNKLKFHLARLDSTRLDSTHSTCRAHAFWLC